MNYTKRILSLTSVMALTAFAAPALAENSSPTSIVGAEGHLSGQPANPTDYSSPVSIVGSRGHAVTEFGSSSDYRSPVSMVGAQGHVPEPVAGVSRSESGFDWSDGLLGLIAGIALASVALGAQRMLRQRRFATSSA